MLHLRARHTVVGPSKRQWAAICEVTARMRPSSHLASAGVLGLELERGWAETIATPNAQ